jgi:hypothetical protein
LLYVTFSGLSEKGITPWHRSAESALPGADTGFHHGGGGFLASLLSLPAGGPGVLPRKILKFYIAVGEF